MAAPGDPEHPDDHDDLVGFSSPDSLRGQPKTADAPAQGFAPPVFEDAAQRQSQLRPAVTPAPAPTPSPPPSRADDIFKPSAEFEARERARHAPPAEPDALPGGGVLLYAIYALILLTVPTFCAAGLVGLLAVWRREPPADALSRSHFIYQKRTLMVGAAVAIAGVILMAAPFALGVPLLFLLFIWLVLRGASGVLALKAGRPIANPNGWWI